jgi:hypothetical protein
VRCRVDRLEFDLRAMSLFRRCSRTSPSERYAIYASSNGCSSSRVFSPYCASSRGPDADQTHSWWDEILLVAIPTADVPVVTVPRSGLRSTSAQSLWVSLAVRERCPEQVLRRGPDCSRATSGGLHLHRYSALGLRIMPIGTPPRSRYCEACSQIWDRGKEAVHTNTGDRRAPSAGRTPPAR